MDKRYEMSDRLNENEQLQILISAITNALKNKKEMLLITELGDAQVFSLQGRPVKLTKLLLQAMKVDSRFELLVNTAYKVHQKDDDLFGDFMSFLRDLANNDWEPLDCDNCPPDIRDSCKVRDEVHCAKEMPEELKNLITEIFNKRDGNGKES